MPALFILEGRVFYGGACYLKSGKDLVFLVITDNIFDLNGSYTFSDNNLLLACFWLLRLTKCELIIPGNTSIKKDIMPLWPLHFARVGSFYSMLKRVSFYWKNLGGKFGIISHSWLRKSELLVSVDASSFYFH